MRIANDTLAELKVYARKVYSINHNIPILTMLITEEEHGELCKGYDEWLKQSKEKGVQIIDMNKKEDLSHYSEEFCPNTACCFSLVHKRPPIHMLTIIVETLFTIPNFVKYKYALIIREEKLLEYAKGFVNLRTTLRNGEVTDTERRVFALADLLTHEFLHIIERELNIRIYTDDLEKDRRIIADTMKRIGCFHNLGKYIE
jgi:hypothetical protein